MTFFIGDPCIDTLDRSCVDECPVDCIYEGARKLYINPIECIDCGACEAVCPVSAIRSDRADLDGAWSEFMADNRRFFENPLPDRSEAIGNPGGALGTGPVGSDTELVLNTPRSVRD